MPMKVKKKEMLMKMRNWKRNLKLLNLKNLEKQYKNQTLQSIQNPMFLGLKKNKLCLTR